MHAQPDPHDREPEIDPGEFSLVKLGLVDFQMPEAFGALSRLAARLLDTPVVIIALFDPGSDRELVCDHIADPSAPVETRHLPRSLNFCRQVAAAGRAIGIDGAPLHGEAIARAVSEIGNIAYLGAPICDPTGKPVGALCVVDRESRNWSADAAKIIADLADNASDEILIRANVFGERRGYQELKSDHDRLSRYSGLRDAICAAFMSPNRPIEARYTDLLHASCRALGFDSAAIARLNCGRAEILAATGADQANAHGQTVELTGQLASNVTRDGSMMKFCDLAQDTAEKCRNLLGQQPGAYVGVPLIVSNALYGVIEFSADQPRQEEWNEEDLSIFCLISLLASANIELLTQAERMRDTEIQFLSILRDHRAG